MSEEIEKLKKDVDYLQNIIKICSKYLIINQCHHKGCKSLQISDGFLPPVYLDCQQIHRCGKCEKLFCDLHISILGTIFHKHRCDNCLKVNEDKDKKFTYH